MADGRGSSGGPAHLLERALAASGSGVIITDPGREDNPIIYVNPAFERVTGYGASEALGRNCRFLQGRDTEQPELEELRAALEKGAGCRVELRNYRKDGALFWNELEISPVRDDDGRLTHFVGVVTDVTERVEAEKARRASEEGYRALAEAATDGIVAIGEDGRITFSNRAAQRMFGYRGEELAGAQITMLMPERLRGPHEAAFRRYLATGERRVDWESVQVAGLHHSGREFPLEVSFGENDAEDGRLFVGYLRDVSERQSNEAALRRQAERLSSVIAIQQEVAAAEPHLQGIMDLVARRTQELTGASGAAVELAEDGELVYRAASGTVASYRGVRLNLDESLSGACVRSGEILRCEDTETDERVDRRVTDRLGIRSMIVVPLKHGREVVGVLKVLSGERHAFEEEDVRTLRLMAGMISTALRHAAEFEARWTLLAERTEALERIRESEARFRTLFEGAPIAIALADSDGRIVQSNLALQEMLGYSEEEILGTGLSERTHPEDAETDRALYRELVAGKRESYEMEKRYIRKDGEQVRALLTRFLTRDDETNWRYAIGMAQDITERKRAEEALAESEARYRQLFTQSAESFLVHDAEGKIVDCNDQACRDHGYTRREMLSLGIRDLTDTLLSEEERRIREESGGTLWQRALSGDSMGSEDVHTGEHIRKDGTRFPVEVWISGITYGERRMILASVRDVTERRQAERALLEIREAERRRIARDLHDAVLQDLSGALQALQASQLESGSAMDLEQELAALRRAVGGLRGAIYDLRAEKEQPFVRAVESLVELNRQATPGREVSLIAREGFPPELPRSVNVELLRVIQEALVNARRHSGARREEVLLWREDGKVCVRVSDDGVGFDPERVSGGVGLSGARERVLALGGEIEVLSEPGRGTSVSVRVPVPESG